MQVYCFALISNEIITNISNQVVSLLICGFIKTKSLITLIKLGTSICQSLNISIIHKIVKILSLRWKWVQITIILKNWNRHIKVSLRFKLITILPPLSASSTRNYVMHQITHFSFNKFFKSSFYECRVSTIRVYTID